jgi:putative membrane protein
MRSERIIRTLCAAIAMWLAGAAALAHGPAEERKHVEERTGVEGRAQVERAPVAEPAPAPGEILTMWSFDPLSVILLLLSGGLYLAGIARLWREASPGRGVRRWGAACFAAGWLALAVALVSPLHPLGSVLFSAHMTQHEALMLVAAPLLVLGRPLIPFLWALPRGWRVRLGGLAQARWFRRAWRLISAPPAAWVIHAAALWIWHIPLLFEATLQSELVHAVQHLSFLLSALLFCWALLYGPGGRMGYGGAVLYIFTTAVHSSILGALLTFSRQPWYPAYARTAPAWGLSALEDQQLGGLIMWVPAGVVYMAAGLILFAVWIRVGRGEEPDPIPHSELNAQE